MSARIAERLGPTRAFIREHLVPLNNIVLLAGSVVAVLDFMAPRLSVLPRIVYGSTGAVSLIFLLAAFTPGMLNRAVAGLLGAAADRPLRSSPPWQISLVLLVLVTLIGAASIAKADAGGLIASQSSKMASWQSSLLGLDERTAAIKAGTDSANVKLDSLGAKLASVSFAGDACPDIECAIGMGASKATLEAFIARGVRLPADPHFLGAALLRLSRSRSPVRMDTVSVYLEHGALKDINVRAVIGVRGEPAERAAIAAVLPAELRSRIDEMFGSRGGCDWRSGLRMTELAALEGDRELYDWLVAHGADPTLSNTWCLSGPFATSFNARSLMAATAR